MDLFTPDYLLYLLAFISMNLMTVMGYNLIFGKGKILHFGVEGVSLVASYAFVIALFASQSFAMGFVVSAICVMLISALFAWMSFRLEPDGFGILSISVHLSLIAIVLNWDSLTRGALGIPQIPRLPFLESAQNFAIVSVSVTAVWIAVLWLLDRSSFGRKLAALAEHEWHAAAVGISRKRTHFLAFLIGGFGSVLGGFFYTQYVHLLHPNDYLYPSLLFFVMLVVAGKPGNIIGLIISTITLTFLKEGLRFVPLDSSVVGPLRLLLFGVILLAAVFWRRKTLFPQRRVV